MKFFTVLFFVLTLVSSVSYANDTYLFNASPLKFKYVMSDNVTIKSKFEFDKSQIMLFSAVYNNTANKFFDFWGIDRKQCEHGVLEVRVISEEDLSNKRYFPGEDDYSQGEWVVVGRYFRYSNTLYIVPPILSEYNWRKNFAHEIVHYLYDDCHIYTTFSGGDAEEHRYIDKFLSAYPKLFY